MAENNSKEILHAVILGADNLSESQRQNAIADHGDSLSDEEIREIDDTCSLVQKLRASVGIGHFSDEQELQLALQNTSQLLSQLTVNGGSNGSHPEQVNTAAAHLPPGTRLDDFELINFLAEGGMGAVYRARQTLLGREVAVKVISTDRNPNPDAQSRFRKEVRAAGRLSHKNIVHAFHAGESEHGPYLAMELIDGHSLSHLIKERGSFPWREACELIRQAACGLQHAHEAGLIHRDIKPSNLMLANDGTLKILDLGLARLDDCNGGSQTRPGQFMGTVDYMAPEQASNPTQVDARADLYSLGCTLFELLTGRPPFCAPRYPSVTSRMMAHQNTPPQRVAELHPDVPQALDELVSQLLAKTPNGRVQSAADVIQRLNAIIGNPVSLQSDSRPLSDTISLKSGQRGNHRAITRLRLLVAAAAFLLIAFGTVFFVRTEHGTLKLEVVDPRLICSIDGNSITVADGSKTMTLEAGLKTLHIRSSELNLDVAKEFTLRGSDNERRMHVVLLENGDVDLLDGVASSDAVMAGKSSTANVNLEVAEQNPHQIKDLTSMIDPSLCQVTGEWSRRNNEILSPSGPHISFLQIPYEPKGEYDVLAEVTPIDVPQLIAVGLASGNHSFHAILTPQFNCLENLDHVGHVESNPSRRHFPNGLGVNKKSLIECRIRGDRIAVTVDDVEVINWQGAPSRLSRNPYWTLPYSKALYLGTQGRFLIHSLRIRELSEAGRQVTPPLVSGADQFARTKEIFGDAAVELAKNLETTGSKLTIREEAYTTPPNASVLCISNPPLEAERSLWYFDQLKPVAGVRGFVAVELFYFQNLPVEKLGPILAAPSLVRLDCRGSGGFSDEHLSILATAHSKLISLGCGKAQFTEHAAESFSQLSSLKVLWGHESNLPDAALVAIAEHGQLTVVGLPATITDVGLASLRNCQNIEQLEILGGARGVTDESVSIIESLPALKSLKLEGAMISDAGLQRLKRLRIPFFVFNPGSSSVLP